MSNVLIKHANGKKLVHMQSFFLIREDMGDKSEDTAYSTGHTICGITIDDKGYDSEDYEAKKINCPVCIETIRQVGFIEDDEIDWSVDKYVGNTVDWLR